MSDVAEIFDVHISSVSRMIKRGDLPCVNLGGTKRIPRVALEKFVESEIAYCPRFSKPFLRESAS
ncbi:helix-turn-helix domain-containing protein [Desulfohalovibrio reitneri]|uniref:helix-turn-helix domain-containing protein n=1 Tax=Desulfohalovibrio reitneri TaxID=1307759 RepID=UPI003CC67F45